MRWLLGLGVLIAYDQLGQWLMRTVQWPIPGSVVGMMLMFLTLLLIKQPPTAVVQASMSLLKHLAFFFVPAGVGILLLFDLLANEWLAMLVSMVLSTVISLLFTAQLMQWLLPATVDRTADDG
ncbi:CidA/LrgA family protein [Marinicella meishanensis]|uniref:CidA/LrgA family protein n=1 Tax=Marinicella meishanensis TaxID=2873263 RepID=UPI001CBADFB5|nr:CidA/LrgA family protein [Marinicella sp. NBU2979]